jgi:hypothetical protein
LSSPHVEIFVILQLDFFARFKVVHLDVDIWLITFNKLKKIIFWKNYKISTIVIASTTKKWLRSKLGSINMHIINGHHGLQNSTCTCGCLSLCANPITWIF